MRSLRFWVLASEFAAVCAGLSAAPAGFVEAHYLNFDHSFGAFPQPTTYTPSSVERDWNVSQVVAYEPGGDGPDIVVSTIPTPIQGGGQLLCIGDPPGQDEGFWVVMNSGFPLGDITVEAMFVTTSVTPPSRTANLQYIVSAEHPGTQGQQAQLRLLGSTLQWNIGDPDGSPGEVTISAPGIVPLTWYHAVGVLDYNSSNPANSTAHLYLKANGVATLADEIGTGTSYDALDPAITVGYAPAVTSLQGPITTLVNRYCIGCSPNNAIGGLGDLRGLTGEIDAVAISPQAGQIFLPNAPPPPSVTPVANFEMYR